MTIEQIYQQFVQNNDTDTAEGERALDVAGDNNEQFDLIGAGLNSKHKAGFFAGFRAAMQLMQEVAQ